MAPRGRPKKTQAVAGAAKPAAPSASSRTSSRPIRKSYIQDSDSDGAISTSDIVKTPATKQTRRQSSFQGVYVPSMDSNSSAKSSFGSAQSTRESSLQYDTPATSTRGTPAMAKSSARNFSGNQVVVESNGKRKRRIYEITPDEVDGNMDTTNDAQMAQMLQEEEYAESEPKRAKKNPGGKDKNIVLDTSDEDELSDALSDASDDMPLSRRLPIRSPGTQRAASKSAMSGLKRVSTVFSTEDTEDDFIDDDEDKSFESDVQHFEGESEDEEDDDDDEENPVLAATTGRQSFANWRRVNQERRQQQRKERERTKLEAAHPELKTMWKTLEAIPKIQTEQAEQPTSITRTLKSFQLEGLNWMMKQEQTQWVGGLLGDEMGMGKTIQAVSLIMSDYPQVQPTLVVVPPVALMQWTNEIKEYTDGKLNVLVYHGTNSKSKKLSVKELKNYDVILISYAGLESAHRKQTKGWSRKDHIVKEDSAIHSIDFHRLILDEAHSIKQRTTGVAKACFALKGRFKWCLSGTPVQNRIGEFFSLLRFLDVKPFANYFCKQCSCSELHWSFDKNYRCTICKHRSLDHVSVFNQEILNPITSSGDDALRKEALRKLRLITDRIMLRRMKRDETASMELPPKEIVIHNEFFGEIERDFSSSIMSNTGRQFDTYVSRGVMLNNYANIFGLIMQMRQVSDHPDLLLKKHAEIGQNVLVCNICDEPAEEAIRSGCKHDFCRACARDYVRTCDASGATPDCPRCHIALSIDFDQPDIEQDEENVKKSSIINRIKMENWTSSTKIEMLVYDLYKLRSKRQTLKSIVFSQFTSMLQLIEWRLRRAGFNTVMLDGSMTPQQRQKSIEYFMNNTNVEVFLVSLKAGGVALNLTEASRVFIVDPWWNPAAEWQSADRCHRIGQKRPCVITRLCIEDSVESRIVMLQEKKAHMINGTVNNDEIAMDKLTPEDMQFLFRGS